LADGADKPTDGSPPRPDPPGYFEGESMTRRRAFSVLVQGLGGAAGAVVVLPAVGFALAPLFDEQEVTWEAVGTPGEFSAENYTPRVITIVEGIGEVGKTTVYIRRGNPELSRQEPDLPQESSDEFIAVSTRCAHAGCPVRFVEAAGNFICPCHGGVYDFQGKVIGGPPVRPLDRFQTRVLDGQVQVGPRYSVTSQLEPVRARDPGEFVGGIWEYIYPPRPSVPPPPN
jgi:menaquinol-cytochrome c reductase iron-sulfur subunit